MYKGVASKIAVFAYDVNAGAPKIGDSANITAFVSKDGASAVQTTDVNPVEVDATNMPGVYVFDLSTSETNADLVAVSAKSSTDGVQIDPVLVYTQPGTSSGFSIDAAGLRAAIGMASADLDDQLDSIPLGVWAYNPDVVNMGTIVQALYLGVAQIAAKTDQLSFSGGRVLSAPDFLVLLNTVIEDVVDGSLGAQFLEMVAKIAMLQFISGDVVATLDGESVIGAGSVIQGPLIAHPHTSQIVGPARPLSVFAGSEQTFVLVVSDSSGNPVDMSAGTKTFVVETASNSPTQLFTTTSIVVSGDDNEIITFTISANDNDQTVGTYQWRLWRDDVVVLHGTYKILPASELP